jgi:hypothetical protein
VAPAGRHWDAPFLPAVAEASRPLAVADGRDLHQAWAQALPSAAHAAAPAQALPADGRAAVQEAAVGLARAAAAPEAGSAAPAASVRQVAAAEAAARDAPPEAAGAAELSGAREAARWAARAAPDAVRRREARPWPAAAAASALPSVAASACRRDRALPFAPGPRRAARPQRAMRSLQIASPLAQSWQAAGDEVWSCDIGSRNQRKRKRGDQQIRVRPQCGGGGGQAGIYFRKTRARPGTPFMAHSAICFKPNFAALLRP